MEEFIRCPADVLRKKTKLCLSYNITCYDAKHLSLIMEDSDAIRIMVHSYNDMRMIEIFYDYYVEHDKEKMLDRVQKVITDEKGCHPFGNIFSVIELEGKRILRDASCINGKKESLWASLEEYEKKHCIKNSDGSFDEYYNNKSTVEILQEVMKRERKSSKIEQSTGNEKLDLLVRNLQNNSDKKLHIQTYARALHLINNDLILAFEGKKEYLCADTYVPVIIMLDEMSVGVFNQIGYREQRTFYKSDLGQEMLRFSYLTTKGLAVKGQKDGFSEIKMNAWLEKVKEINLWQVAQCKITEEILDRYYPVVRSLLNNRILELGTIKSKPEESMYDGYWLEDKMRSMYMDWYTKGIFSNKG